MTALGLSARVHGAEPSALGWQDVVLTVPRTAGSRQTIKRRGTLMIRPGAKGTVLLCHPYRLNRLLMLLITSETLFPDYNVFTFDFRAHGEDVTPDQVCTLGKNEALEVKTAARYLHEHQELKNLPVYIYGISMGAVASLRALSEDPTLATALWADCPFDTSTDLMGRSLQKVKWSIFGYEYQAPRWFSNVLKRYSYHPYVQGFLKALLRILAGMDSATVPTTFVPLDLTAAAKKLQVPVFFVTCEKDETIAPRSAVKRLYDAVPHAQKSLWITKGSGHAVSIIEQYPVYRERVRTFFAAMAPDMDRSQYQWSVQEDK